MAVSIYVYLRDFYDYCSVKSAITVRFGWRGH